MSIGLSVKTAVIGGIAAVALLSQLLSGVGQYFDRMAMGREQVREINEAVLQPVAELAARGINGGNQMMLTDAAAMALYKASGVRYLAFEGMSEGAPKSAFTEAIPPQKVTHEYVAEGSRADPLKAAANGMNASGLLEKDYLYVIKTPLPAVKNGGQLVAVFSAERLASLPLKTLREVMPLALGVIALGLVLAWFIGGRIARPITRLAAGLEEVASSLDLTRRVELTSADIAFNREAGDTAQAFNGLQLKLHETLNEVLTNVAQVNQAVERVSGLASTVANRSEEQSDSSAHMAAAMEQSTANLAEIAHNAEYLDKSSRESGALSASGAVIIHNASDEMGVIARTVQEGTASIEALGHESHKISAIVKVIREIADQTNLLALNAAIEAARAGEQGRGFAVVADEVRKLAERTSQSTAEITGMISAIQTSSNSAIGVMEDTVKRVGEGVDLASQAGRSITQISESNEHVMSGVEAITEALRQQNLAYQEIQRHVERIAQMTEQNSHAASDAARAAQELEGLSRSMRAAVSRFRL